MGKKLDALLGRSFKTAKFKPLVKFAISRLAILKNQRQVRCKQSCSDVLQLLEQGLHERALLRVEHVIKDQNMLDVYVMIEGYCDLLIERIHLLEQERECPEELNEAVSGLMFAASRCGDFPELQEIRSILTSRFGKEFAARAVELRNNCGVNPKMIQKLSTRMPNLESRMKALKEIALEANIVLQLEQTPETTEGQVYTSNRNQAKPDEKLEENFKGKRVDSDLSDSFKAKQKYKDVADAAQAAFESAAYAASAARAALELSRSEPRDPDDPSFPNSPSNFLSVKQQTQKHLRIPDQAASKFKVDNKEASVSNYASSSNMQHEQTKVSADAVSGDESNEEEAVFDESHNEPDDNIEVVSGDGDPKHHALSGSGFLNPIQLDFEKKPFSVRTRRLRGY